MAVYQKSECSFDPTDSQENGKYLSLSRNTPRDAVKETVLLSAFWKAASHRTEEGSETRFADARLPTEAIHRSIPLYVGIIDKETGSFLHIIARTGGKSRGRHFPE